MNSNLKWLNVKEIHKYQMSIEIELMSKNK